jgi:ATP-dependent Clp protease ATP-binding subunit ClpB
VPSGPRFSPDLNSRIFEAHDFAGQRGDTHSDVGHLLVAILAAQGRKVSKFLDGIGWDVEELARRAERALPAAPRASSHAIRPWGSDEAVQVTGGFMTVLDSATERAHALDDSEVDEVHVLWAIAAGDHPASRVLDGMVFEDGAGRRQSLEDGRPRGLDKLALYGRVLTDEAREGLLDPVIGRTRELERLVHILGRRRKNNPVLLGEPGVGKTAIVEGLAQAIVDGTVPSSIAGRHIFALDIGSLVAGTKYRGEFESRIQDLLESIRSSEGRIIMFIDELHLIARAGGAEGAINAAGFLKPMLARGELRAIGATTFADYRDVVLGDGALERRFQPIHVRVPTPREAVEMLRGLRHRYEEHHALSITDSALVVAVEASDLRVPYRNLPDKAIDLIDEASSRKRAMAEAQGADLTALEVSAEDVIAVLEEWVGDEQGEWSDGVYGELTSRPSD